jgi:endo-1,4-beta-xylanase
MLYEACPTLSRFRVVFSAVSVLMLSTLLSGCGGGGGTSPAGVNAASSVITVTGDDSLASRAAAKGLVYGAAVKTSYLADSKYAHAFATECGMLVPETELKWGTLRPAPDRFDFSAADALFAFAQSHNMQLRGHTLVWHSSIPSWFQGSVTPENAEQVLTSHISTVVGRYAGKVHSWDVVNEALNPSEHAPKGFRASSPWYQLLGPRYIEIAFRAAAQADPNALLVYNDYGLECDTPDGDARRNATLALLGDLKAAGVPIHALGLQAHLNGGDFRFNPLKFSIFLKQVASLGLKIMITELDVRDQDLPAAPDTRDQMVAATYSSFLSTVLSEPAVVVVMTWGLSDSYSWNGTYYRRSDGAEVRPLPLDAQMNRKLAWTAIAHAIDTAAPR